MTLCELPRLIYLGNQKIAKPSIRDHAWEPTRENAMADDHGSLDPSTWDPALDAVIAAPAHHKIDSVKPPIYDFAPDGTQLPPHRDLIQAVQSWDGNTNRR